MKRLFEIVIALEDGQFVAILQCRSSKGPHHATVRAKTMRNLMLAVSKLVRKKEHAVVANSVDQSHLSTA